MGGRYLTQMDDWLRAAGLTVVEVDGWQTRGRSSGGFDGDRPWVVMWHHTASQTSPQNDVEYMVNGSPDKPVANLLLARDGTIWLMAAAATNTNGKGYAFKASRGTVPNDQMNTHAVSIEAANNGTGEAWTQQQIDAYFRASLALTEALGLSPGDVCTHETWAPDRKRDPSTAAAVQGPWRPSSVNANGSWSLADITLECHNRAAPQEDDDVEVIELRVGGADAVFLALLAKAGGKDAILWCEWVNGADPAQLARLNAYREMKTRVYSLASPANLSGVGLIGPLPIGDGKHQWKRSDFGNVIT